MDVSLVDDPVVVDGGSGEAGAESEGPEEGAGVDESSESGAGRGCKFAPHRVVHYHYR